MECKIRIERQEWNSGIILTNLSDSVTLYWEYSYSASPYESSTSSVAPGNEYNGVFDNRYGMIFYLKENDTKYNVGCKASTYYSSWIIFFGKEGVIDMNQYFSKGNPFSVDITLTTEPLTDTCRLTSNRLSPPKFKLRKFFNRVKNRISNLCENRMEVAYGVV